MPLAPTAPRTHRSIGSTNRFRRTCYTGNGAIQGEEGPQAVEEPLQVQMGLPALMHPGHPSTATLHNPAGKVHHNPLVPKTKKRKTESKVSSRGRVRNGELASQMLNAISEGQNEQRRNGV
jgi:hypothetical protein